MMAYIQILRPLNLVIVVLTQSIIYYFVLSPQLSAPALSVVHFTLLALCTAIIAGSGYLINDIRKTWANRVTRAFSDMLQERGFSMKTLNELGKLCRDLSFERNGAAHISFYSRDEVMEKRGEMVKIINGIISIVSRSGGGS